MSETVDVLRRTLAAQGIETGHSVAETIGAKELTSSLVDPASSLPEVSIAVGGDYEVRSVLGRGGMGVVELATQRALKREVAIKRLSAPTPALVRALLHEATITGQLEHPNIVPVHAVVSDARGPAVVMKRISGMEWQTLIEAAEAPLDRHLDVFSQVCRAVAFAHSRDVVHRDIKPANVMLGEYGEVYLVDWGLARRLEDGVFSNDRLAGTPAFIAPEMIHGRADPRSDVYLLGATLHEVLTGSPRHDGKTLLEVLTAAEHSAPHEYTDDVPAELAQICNRACARDPQDRFQTAHELHEAVLRYLEHRSASTLVHAGEERMTELRTLLADSAEYPKVQRLFSEARFAFEQALEAWPEGELARAGRENCLVVMARHELVLRHPENAAALLDAMFAPPPDLRSQIDALRAERDAERKRLAQLERDNDPRVGADERGRAALFLAAGVFALVGTFVSFRILAPAYASSSLRLLLISGVVFLVGTWVILRWWRRAEVNLINRRIGQIVVATLSISLLHRTLGHISAAEVDEILRADALILLGGGLALTPFHPAGRWLAIFAGIVATVGAFRPSWLELMFIVLGILVPVAFMLTRARKAKPDPT